MTTEETSRSFRLHVSGLPAHITESDIKDRFRSFGTVQSVEIVKDQFNSSACRGFAYVQVESVGAKVQKCMGLLNGSSWKGGKLQISHAKPSKQVKKGEEDVSDTASSCESTSSSTSNSISSSNSTKSRKKLIRMASDQSLVTDKSAATRKGWRKGRYGRAIAIMRVRKPNGQVIVVDPVHYKAGLERLFGTVTPKPLKELDWGESEKIFSQGDLEVEFASNSECSSDEDKKSEPSESEIEAEVEAEKRKKTKKEKKEKKVQEVKKDKKEKKVEKAKKEPKAKKDKKDKKETMVENEQTICEPEPIAETNLVSVSEPVSELDSSIQIQAEDIATPTQEEFEEESIEYTPSVEPFKVNVSWNQLFSPAASGFSLNLFSESKPSNSSFSSTAASVPEPVKPVISEPAKPKNFNFAHLFASSPSVKRLFGCTDRERALEDWRQDRFDLKADCKKKVSDGKRKQRKRQEL